ncbi:MAG TPA: ABC transporter ATP-binding protein [Spirochaetia bacterium]|nr:ABC transporter ATP-binding protein [Spirochaetia bacterium]
MKAIETEGLGKTYDNGVRALSGLSFGIEEGEIFGLLGPNGAGKSTTVRLLNGTLAPTEGRSTVLGRESRTQELRAETSTVAELAQMYEHMTVAENLQFFAILYDIPPANAACRIDELLARLHVLDRKDHKLGSLSTGLKKRVHLARALLHRPRIVFFDEPTSGLDPESAREVVELIETMAREEATTVLLCTHNLPLAEGICDSFGFLAGGRLIRYGRKRELLEAVMPERQIRLVTDAGEETHPYTKPMDVNRLVQQAMDGGRIIREVRQVVPSLEDAYFHFVGRTGSGNGIKSDVVHIEGRKNHEMVAN